MTLSGRTTIITIDLKPLFNGGQLKRFEALSKTLKSKQMFRNYNRNSIIKNDLGLSSFSEIKNGEELVKFNLPYFFHI